MKTKWVLFSVLVLSLFAWILCQTTSETVDIPINIQGNVVQEITAFGLDVVFDPNVYEFQSITNGSLTQDWGNVDGNIVEAGRLRIGGYAGSGTAIIGNVDGTLAVVMLSISSNVVLENFVDDIKNMEAESTAVVFIQ